MLFSRGNNRVSRLTAIMFLLISWLYSQAVSAQETEQKPKVIEFYASWCEPCRRLQPVMDRARAEYKEEVEFVSYNVDDPQSREALEKYGVCPIPTLIFVDSDKNVSAYAIGCTEERNIRKNIRKILPETILSATSHNSQLN